MKFKCLSLLSRPEGNGKDKIWGCGKFLRFDEKVGTDKVKVINLEEVSPETNPPAA